MLRTYTELQGSFPGQDPKKHLSIYYRRKYSYVGRQKLSMLHIVAPSFNLSPDKKANLNSQDIMDRSQAQKQRSGLGKTVQIQVMRLRALAAAM